MPLGRLLRMQLARRSFFVDRARVVDETIRAPGLSSGSGNDEGSPAAIGRSILAVHVIRAIGGRSATGRLIAGKVA